MKSRYIFKINLTFFIAVFIWAPQIQGQAEATVRIASAKDVAAIPQANIGDLIIAGGNEKEGNLPAIYLGKSSEWPLGPGKKVLIKGGVYEYIAIYNHSSGAPGNPIIITNYGGQVETKSLSIHGLKHFKLTGRFDPTKKTGDKAFPGHANGYAFTQGRYGFFINNRWTKKDRFLLEISGYSNKEAVYPTSDYEVEYVESGNGGYSNVFKYNDRQFVVENVRIHDCYIHDTDGEGIYLGNTSGSSAQEVFRNLQVYNNRILRTGLDALQLGRVAENSRIYNNVIDGAMNWRSAFERYQDFGASLIFISGNIQFSNNIIINGGGACFQLLLKQEPWYAKLSPPRGSVLVENNLLNNARSGISVYLGPWKKQLDGVKLEISRNDFAKSNFEYDEVYHDVDDEDHVINAGYAGVVLLQNNRWDPANGKDLLYDSEFEENVSMSNNNKSGIQTLAFENYYGRGFGVDKFDMWTEKVMLGSDKGGSMTYETGHVVVHKSKIYKCIKSNSAKEPGLSNDWKTYWQLMLFNNGKSFLPADDVRLVRGNLHKKLKRGLMD